MWCCPAAATKSPPSRAPAPHAAQRPRSVGSCKSAAQLMDFYCIGDAASAWQAFVEDTPANTHREALLHLLRLECGKLNKRQAGDCLGVIFSTYAAAIWVHAQAGALELKPLCAFWANLATAREEGINVSSRMRDHCCKAWNVQTGVVCHVCK
jgi:hypothetical protein